MGVKKHESGERNGRVRKRLFMRGETRQRVGEAGEEGQKRKAGETSSVMVEKTNGDVMYLIGPWILDDECDRTSI